MQCKHFQLTDVLDMTLLATEVANQANAAVGMSAVL
jgi:hypothetical protein